MSEEHDWKEIAGDLWDALNEAMRLLKNKGGWDNADEERYAHEAYDKYLEAWSVEYDVEYNQPLDWLEVRGKEAGE